MGLAPQLITDALHKKAEADLKTLTQTNREAIRLQAIVSAKTQGVTLVAKVFSITPNTLRSWVKSYADEGLSGLEYKSGRGRKSKLSDEYLEDIRTWTQANCNITIAEIVSKLKQVHGIESSKSAVHRALHKLDLSYITPRPVHHKQDKGSHPEFKKKSHGKNEGKSQ
jgi:transposase